MALTENDKAILDTVLETECDLGIKVDVDAAGDVWSRASMRWNRDVELLGRVSDPLEFQNEFRRRWRAGSA
jgi:hypothetical protein